ncbi:MAG: UMP kinase [Coprobacillus sp.]|nr:UMP kinase [Coprobacillus sp.]
MYKRILLKLSGESLRQEGTRHTIDVDYLKETAQIIKDVHDEGIEVAIVVGAGNIWRGKLANQIGIERVPADYMGMLGTVINAVAINSALKNLGCAGEVFSSITPIKGVTKAYKKSAAKKSLSAGNVIFLAGGTGKPYLTTDTAAAMLAKDISVDAILMSKNNVDGVYDSDPKTNKDAKLLKTITYQDILDKNLEVMDKEAAELLCDTNIEIRVFNAQPENFVKVLSDETLGTTVRKEK